MTHAGAACPTGVENGCLHEWAGVDSVWEFLTGRTEGAVSPLAPAPRMAGPAGATVGRPRPGRTLEIRDGVIWCRTPQFARFEYWNDPSKTAAAWDGDAFSVGDLGRLDDGFLFLEGRREDLIITGGVNVYPAEVEAVLAECPEVQEVAVFGRDDPAWGQRVCVAYSGAATEESLQDWATQHLASFKRPKQIEHLDALPHNASGKVERLHPSTGGAS